MAPTSSPTVALVHGAFSDTSFWSEVIVRLREADIPAVALANPLRGLAHDGEYIAAAVNQIDGPVVLVGHSYGGPVITYAGTKAPNARALVFIASFGLDREDTSIGSVEAFSPSEFADALQPRTYPGAGGEPDTELYVQAGKFRSVMCGDLPAERAALLALMQRPAVATAFTDPLPIEPAWKKLPSWFIIPGDDHGINPDSQRAAAKRMGATTVEIDGGSHCVAISQPDRVTAVILDARTAIMGNTVSGIVTAAAP